MTTGRNNTIGQRYQIIEQIGAGGMGTVFRAYDLEIERDVALKWLPAYFSGEMTFVERFKREARVIARLEHPHIVPIYDVGEHEGRPFIIMRLLSGGTLRERMERPDFNMATLVKSMEQIGDALTTAHAQQIIHRDLKPGNILFDENGAAFLSDFGIAKVLDSATQLTGSGLIGTPAYMSPEQFIGQGIDGRSDQYSLAVVIFEVLAGRLPFEGNTAQMMYKHLNVEPPDIDLAQKPLPTTLNPALRKALSKNPESRYATIAEFVGALRAAITADPEAARFVLPPVPDRRTPSRKTPLTAPTEVDTPSPHLMDRLRRDYRTGLEAMNRSEWTTAVAAFDRVLSTDPSYGDALQLRAQAQTRVTAAQTAAAPPPPEIEKTSLEAPVGAVPLDVTQIETPSMIPVQPQPHRKREAASAAAVAATAAATAAGAAATAAGAAAPAVPHPPKPAPAQPKAAGLPAWTRLAGVVAAVLLLVLAGFFALRALGGDGNEPQGEAGPAVAGAVETPTTAPAEETESSAAATQATEAGAAGADATDAGAAGTGAGAGGANAGGAAVVAPTNTPEPTPTAAPSSTPEPATAAPAAAPPMVRVTVSSANLRTGPGTIYSIAGVIRQGEEIKVLATNRDGAWYNVELPDGSRAWIARNITEPVDGANLQALPVAATVPAPPTATRPAAQPTSPPQQPPTSPPQQPPTSPPQQPTSPPQQPTSPPPPPPPPTEPPPPPATYTPVPIDP